MIRSLTVTITDFGNAAMADDPEFEVARVFVHLADAVRTRGVHGLPEVIHDSNGNAVGTAKIEFDVETKGEST